MPWRKKQRITILRHYDVRTIVLVHNLKA